VWWCDAPGDGVVPPVAFCDADADAVACAALLDDEVVAWPVLEAEVELDDPPHAARSSTSDPSPATAGHPLLRITSLRSQG
jgi:hypothetical protein